MANVLARKANSLKNRILRWAKHHNAHYFLDPERAFTKRFIDKYQGIDSNQIEVGNYYLDKRQPIDNQSVVYSFGILTDVDFDQAVIDQFGSEVHMYDPTPLAVEFMSKQTNPKFKFNPFGIWIEETTLTFHLPKHGGSASAVNIDSEGEKFEARCKTVPQVMKENGHSHIDVLKMDIEGAALPIIEKMIEVGIFPTQVVAEFERPRHDVNKNIDFFYRLDKICKTFEAQGFEIICLPREIAKYYSLEMLFVKVKKIP